MTLRDQIRSDPGRICSRVIAWDQALWWGSDHVQNIASHRASHAAAEMHLLLE